MESFETEVEVSPVNRQKEVDATYEDNPIFTGTHDESVYKTNNVNIKKRCWIIGAITVLCCVCIGIGVFLSLKSPAPRTMNDSSNDTRNLVAPSFMPSQSPSFQPTTFDCNDLCLSEIEEADCPENSWKLKSCESVEVDKLCFDGSNCPTAIESHQCGGRFHIYRRKQCSHDEPWRRVTNGFEFYVETLLMDLESHRQRAIRLNSSLASIHSEDEMNIIIEMLSEMNVNEVIVGGIRKGTINDPWNNGSALYWKWVDGTPWDFTSWQSGHPNDQNTINGVHGSVVVLSNLGMYEDLPSINLQALYKRPSVGTYHTNVMIGLGNKHSCMSNFEENLYCWGSNYHGEIGDGTTTDKYVPTLINFGNGRLVTKLAVGWDHTCAILDDNSLKCWGSNTYGQLGDATTIDKSYPTEIDIGADRTIIKLALGGYHTCAVLDNDSLKCWGRNNKGQLGDGTKTDRNIPTAINIGVGKNVTHLSLGRSHTCIVLDNSLLKCWGKNTDGQLGDGTLVDKHIPKEIDFDGDGRNVIQLALGLSHTCVLLDDSSLKCWGLNVYGQIGDGTNDETPDPTDVNVSGEGKTVSNISLGNYHTCAVLDGGNILKCWGLNLYGQLGDGTINEINFPTKINVGHGRTITQLVFGGYHTCVELDGKYIRCWGRNDHGQLGNGSNDTSVQYESSWEEYVII